MATVNPIEESSLSESRKLIRIGSRKSQLALVQSYWVRDKLTAMYPQGDKILNLPLSEIGDKGLFTRELETGISNKSLDMAVHSLKDLPTTLPAGLGVGVICERENPLDAVVLHEKHKQRIEKEQQEKEVAKDSHSVAEELVQGEGRGREALSCLPSGAVIGTSSLRRVAQLKAIFPQFEFKSVRGNLQTRLGKLDAGGYDALILAAAGLDRMGLKDRIFATIASADSLPAVGQGALAVECRTDDIVLIQMLEKCIGHKETTYRCLAERAFLRSLEGGCQAPIAAFAQVYEGGNIVLSGRVLSLDGQHVIEEIVNGKMEEGERLGKQAAEKALKRGAGELVRAARKESEENH